MARKNIDMTKGNPARQMALFALPVVAGGVLQQLYNAADSVIAGRLIGSGALAAVSNAGTVVFFITIMFLGIGNGASITDDSFSIDDEGTLVEGPVFTKPPEWRGLAVPEVLLSGDHKKIARWRQEQREAATRERRPDLWAAHLAGLKQGE